MNHGSLSCLVKNIYFFTDLHYILLQQVILQAKNPGFVVFPCVIPYPFVFLPLSTFFFFLIYYLVCFGVRPVCET